MVALLLKRYLWLIDTLRRSGRGLTLAEINPNRSLETELALFLMTAIRKMWLYIVGS